MNTAVTKTTLTLTAEALEILKDIGDSPSAKPSTIRKVKPEAKSAVVLVAGIPLMATYEGEAQPFVGEVVQLDDKGQVSWSPVQPVAAPSTTSSPSVRFRPEINE